MTEPALPSTFYDLAILTPSDEPVSGLTLPALIDHELHIFHGIDRSRSDWDRLEINLGAITALPSGAVGRKQAGDWIPPDVRTAIGTRYASQPVWERKTVSAGADFHSHLRNLVSGKSSELSILWTATALTRRLLARADLYQEDLPREARTARTLVWVPSNSIR
jgi:hypothetical protein